MKAPFLTALAALLLLGCGDSGGRERELPPLPPAIPAPGNADWTGIVSETPPGGYLMGNPDAPVKLVEYASVTCPHCALFSRQGTEPLKALVRSGHVSWEFRPYLIFLTDPAVSLIATCQGARSFFAVTGRIYAGQSDWVERVRDLPSEDLDRIRALPEDRQPLALARRAGLDRLLQADGVPQAMVDSCLLDQQRLQKFEALTDLGKREGVPGTPTFFINGRILPGVGDWSALQPEIRAAIPRPSPAPAPQTR